jgi:RNA polymerase sigma factor (sigma-70 family)
VDTGLVLRAQGGDETAFAIITDQVVGRFQRVAFGILRDRLLAEDAAQAGLIQIWKKLPRLRDPARFDAWAHKLLVHACYAEAKRARRAEVALEYDVGTRAPDGLTTVADRDQLERGFRRLTLDQRAVIVLRVYFDLPTDEVAEALGVSVGTVKSRLNRALSSLRAAIEADARHAPSTNASMEVSR